MRKDKSVTGNNHATATSSPTSTKIHLAEYLELVEANLAEVPDVSAFVAHDPNKGNPKIHE
jgi:hypothetical protein